MYFQVAGNTNAMLMDIQGSLGGIADPGGVALRAVMSVLWQAIRAVFNPLEANFDILAVMDGSGSRTGSVPMAACAAALDRRPGCLRIVADGSEVILCLQMLSHLCCHWNIRTDVRLYLTDCLQLPSVRSGPSASIL